MFAKDYLSIGMEAFGLIGVIFHHHQLCTMEVVKYQCEEKPHFAEAKRKNPKARRSVAKAIQHTPDFAEPAILIQKPEDLVVLQKTISGLKEVDPSGVEIASYMSQGDHKVRIHEALKVISRVKTRQGIFHIPLLDLDLPIDEASPASAEEVSFALGVQSGAILDSGRSYHLWGLQLLSDADWRTFMYRALLLDRVDSRWIGHRLIDGQANLRISEKRGKVPTVVHLF